MVKERTKFTDQKKNMLSENSLQPCLRNAYFSCSIQKQPPRGVLRKRCSENMPKIYRRTPMPSCRSAISIRVQNNFIEIALRYGCSPINLLHIFRTFFLGTPLGRCFCPYFCLNASKFLHSP